MCLLLRGHPQNEVLLGYKKRGFGAGKWVGLGGKKQPGETLKQAAVREVEEEAGVRVAEGDLRAMGRLTFVFPARPDWDFVAHVFVAERWQGEPVESDEVHPSWFPIARLPFAQMWQDAPYWLPQVLAGKQVHLRFTFAHDNETVQEVD